MSSKTVDWAMQVGPQMSTCRVGHRRHLEGVPFVTSRTSTAWRGTGSRKMVPHAQGQHEEAQKEIILMIHLDP